MVSGPFIAFCATDWEVNNSDKFTVNTWSQAWATCLVKC